jgi:hypothetical protein
MSALANDLAATDACTLWNDEVRKLSVVLPELGPAARTAVRSVLVALAADESLDATERADVQRLLVSPRSSTQPAGASRRSPLRAMVHAMAVHSAA